MLHVCTECVWAAVLTLIISSHLSYMLSCVFLLQTIFLKTSPVSQEWLLVSFRRSYIRFILILSIKGNLTSSHSNMESGPWTLWHRNERTTGGKVLEPALVIKHLWAREQGTVVTKCMNYSKPEHTRFVSASPQRCHRDFKTEKREVRSVIHPSGWTCWFIRVAA